MFVFSHKVNCPPVVLCNAQKKMHHRARARARLSVASVVVQSDEGETSPAQSKKMAGSGHNPNEFQYHTADHSLLNQSNTIGIIGGVSAFSTLIFLEKLVWWSSRHGEESLPYVVCSDPFLSFKSKGDQKEVNFGLIIKNLHHKRKFLEQSGVGCLVMPCHLLHSWYGEISEGCLLPFLHVGECVTSELKEAKLRPLEAGCNVRIGLLATDDTLKASFYQDKLQNQGFEVVLPDKPTMDHILIPAVESLKQKDITGAQNLLRIAIQVLLVRAVNKVILASDEILGLLPPNDPLLKKCIDPMDALARSTIRWARSTKSINKESE